MNGAQFFGLLAAIYLAPNLSPPLRMALGIVCALCAGLLTITGKP